MIILYTTAEHFIFALLGVKNTAISSGRIKLNIQIKRYLLLIYNLLNLNLFCVCIFILDKLQMAKQSDVTMSY